MKPLPIIRKVLSASFVAILFSAFAAFAAAQNPPLSLADLLIGLRSKKATIEERNQILTRAVTERGVTFVNTPEIEKELIATGADAGMITAVRARSAKPTPPPPPVKPVATPTPADFYSKRADASLAKGDVDSALADYDKALEIKADDPTLYVSRGKALFTKNSFDQSVKDYDKAIELAPKTAVAFLNRGASYEKLGDVQKALTDYRSASDLDSANETARAEVKRIETQLAKEEADRKAKDEAAKAEAARLATPPEFLNLGSLSSDSAIRLVTPTYSPIARQSRVTGKVTVEVTLDDEGNVTKANAIAGPAMLRQSAEDAANRSKFKPATFNGTPIKAKGVITYNFSL
ncbi:MAG: TonB family protein [bacterium]|nr:TonB family protein [bacterium]